MLKQAPRAWYERLTQFLLENNYVRGGVDKTLFIKRDQKDIMIAQIYVDDIVFGGKSQRKVELFVEQIKKEFDEHGWRINLVFGSTGQATK